MQVDISFEDQPRPVYMGTQLEMTHHCPNRYRKITWLTSKTETSKKVTSELYEEKQVLYLAADDFLQFGLTFPGRV